MCYYGVMIDFTVKGAIFDIDDTLLDNKPDISGGGLHERSRLQAVQEVGKKHGIKELEHISIKDNWDAFQTAPVHTIESAVWNMFVRAGLADSVVPNLDDPLLKEIVKRKDELHEVIMIEEADEVAGASAFVKKLAASGLQDTLAIASSAARRDVDIFLRKKGIDDCFPPERITTKEDITHSKPNPEIFNRAFDTLGLPEADRSQVCAFEDDARGIMSARAAGLYVCAIATRFPKEELMALEVPPHVVADSFAEFEELFGLK